MISPRSLDCVCYKKKLGTDSQSKTMFIFQVKRGGNKNVTPYIIFASQIRKKVSDENKGATFGEISKIVGDSVSFMSKFLKFFCTFSF